MDEENTSCRKLLATFSLIVQKPDVMGLKLPINLLLPQLKLYQKLTCLHGVFLMVFIKAKN